MPNDEFTDFPFYAYFGHGAVPNFVQFRRSGGSPTPQVAEVSAEAFVDQTVKLGWTVTFTTAPVNYRPCFYYIGEFGPSCPLVGFRVVEVLDGKMPKNLPPPLEKFKDIMVEIQPGGRVMLLLEHKLAERDDFRTFVIGDRWRGKYSFYSIHETLADPPSGPIEA